MEEKYEYAFGQWVIVKAGGKYRFLKEDAEGDAVMFDTEKVYTEYFPMGAISPDPNPPELVAGQLVMVRDNEEDDWEGPYRYLGYDDDVLNYKHNVMDADYHQYAKPYIPNPVEPALTDTSKVELKERIAEIESELSILKELIK